MIIDLFSRKIVSWEIWDHESSEKASLLVRKAVYSEKILLKDKPLILHSDNGSWVDAFVKYYNNEHHHSSLKFPTPNQRHNGHSEGILAKRKEILEAARAEHPERWSGSVQDCTIEQRVWLNPAKEKNKEKAC